MSQTESSERDLGDLTEAERDELIALRKKSEQDEMMYRARIEVRDEMLRIQKDNEKQKRRIDELTEDNYQLTQAIQFLLKEYETHITRRVWEDMQKVLRLYGAKES